MSARRPYVRPMAGWWRRNPWFGEYMLHEATALAVAAYALILLAGLFQLVQGEAAWVQWLAFLASPLALALHAVLLLAFAYRPLVDRVMRLDEWVVASNRRLWLFVAVLFVLPAIFLTSGIWLGPIAS